MINRQKANQFESPKRKSACTREGFPISAANIKARFIQWVGHCPSHNSPVKAEARIFHPLFKSRDPSAHPSGDFLNDINPHSEDVYPNAMIDLGFNDIRSRAPWPKEKTDSEPKLGPESVRFQAMRIAYFAVDSDTTEDKVVLNRIVPIKEGM